MRTLFFATLLLLAPLFAHADDAATATAPAGSTVTYTSSDYDFSLALPGGGLIADKASDPQWDYDENTVFTWVDTEGASPVFLVMGSALKLDSDATDDDVADFVTGLTDEKTNTDNKTEVEDVSDVFNIGERGWVSVLYKDNNSESPGEFEIFVTRQGPYIYAVAFHYTSGKTQDAEAAAGEVLASFVTSQG